jgi:hypothetical protein
MISAFLAKKRISHEYTNVHSKKSRSLLRLFITQNMISAFVAKKNNQPRIHECSLIKIQIAAQIIYNPKYD